MRANVRLLAVAAALASTVRPGWAWDSQVPNTCREHEQWNADWASEHNEIVARIFSDLGVTARYLDQAYPFSRAPRRSHLFTCSTPFDHDAQGCAGSLDSVKASDGRYVTDLGAWMVGGRPALGEEDPNKKREKCGDLGPTGLEERFVPTPHHFGELPDAVYSVYDWIGKASSCPPFPGAEVDHFAGVGNVALGPGRYLGDGCHRFQGWMGALNSNHFGTQAANHYKAYHDLALWLAKRAKDRREQIRAKAPEDSDHDVYIEEAEREALIFEAVSQHFLADRWSSGHMWERWGAPDLQKLRGAGVPDDGLSLVLLAVLSGFFHGAEGVLGFPMPLCSPLVNDAPLPASYLGVPSIDYQGVYGYFTEQEPNERCPDSLDPQLPGQFASVKAVSLGIPEFRVKGADGVEGIPLPAVGDHRFEQMTVFAGTGEYGLVTGWWNPADYLPGDGYFKNCFIGGGKFLPLNTKIQLSSMEGCARASAWEVIQAFGKNGQDGFGLHKIMPTNLDLDGDGRPDNPPDLAKFDLRTVDGPCLGPYITNQSVLNVLKAYEFTIPDLAASIVMIPAELIEIPIPVVGTLINDVLTGPAEETLKLAFRAALTAMLALAKLAVKTGDADGTGFARNPPAIPVLGYQAGDKYALGNASYIDGPGSDDLDKLPDVQSLLDPRLLSLYVQGNDKRNLYGFFNRAHADYWCEKVQLWGGSPGYFLKPVRFDNENNVYLENLRGSKNPADLEACALLFDRFYRRSKLTGWADFEVRDPKPICDILSTKVASNKFGYPQQLPIGYSFKANALVDDVPWYGRYLRSVVNYCRKIPVVHVDSALDVPGPGRIYYARDVKKPVMVGEPVMITGIDFGLDPKVKVNLVENPGKENERKHEAWVKSIGITGRRVPMIEFVVQRDGITDGFYALEVDLQKTDAFGRPLKSEPTAWIEVKNPVRRLPRLGGMARGLGTSLISSGYPDCSGQVVYDKYGVPTITCEPLQRGGSPCVFDWRPPALYANGSAQAQIQRTSATEYDISLRVRADPTAPPAGAGCATCGGVAEYTMSAFADPFVQVELPIDWEGPYRIEIEATGRLDQMSKEGEGESSGVVCGSCGTACLYYHSTARLLTYVDGQYAGNCFLSSSTAPMDVNCTAAVDRKSNAMVSFELSSFGAQAHSIDWECKWYNGIYLTCDGVKRHWEVSGMVNESWVNAKVKIIPVPP